MSRTVKSERATTPAEQHIFLNMKDGKFGKLDDSSQNIENISTPISFIPLDDKAFKIVGDKRVRGAEKRSIKSTLAHFTKKDKVKVYFNDTKEVIANGKWSEIKTVVAFEGGKAALQIYSYFPMDKKIGVLALRGRSYMEWINFCKENRLGNDACATLAERRSAVTISGVKLIKDTTGDGSDSYVPVFTVVPIGKQETLDAADAADESVQQYFNELFAGEQVVEAVQNVETEQSKRPEYSDNWVNETASTPYPEASKVQTVPSSFSDDSFPTLADVPPLELEPNLDLPF